LLWLVGLGVVEWKHGDAKEARELYERGLKIDPVDNSRSFESVKRRRDMGDEQQCLQRFLEEVGGVAGTVHLHEEGGLRLAAAVNIPEKVQQVVAWVPSGKGMAGLALERGEPVFTCNLKDDQRGDVRPGAKAVEARAAIAFPVRDESGRILAVVGAAFNDEHTFEPSEIAEIEKAAALFAV
jgi:L-methionine (R)-S-oxide reductase